MKGFLFIFLCFMQVLDEDNHLLSLGNRKAKFTVLEACASHFLATDVVADCKIVARHGLVGALRKLRCELPRLNLRIVLDVEVFEVTGRNLFLNFL